MNCEICLSDQPLDQFYLPGRPASYGIPLLNQTCKKCRRKAARRVSKKSYKRPPGYASRYKQRVFDLIAGKDPSCHCCGEKLRAVLSLKGKGTEVWCLNCKWATGLYGACHT